MTRKMIETAYVLENTEETRDFYEKWAATYDAEVAENGYVTPSRCAMALAEVMADKTAPILDIGCGTGISGAALAEAGFTTIDGTDFSDAMLAKAAEKSVYRNLRKTDLSDPFPFAAGRYAAIAAIGVLTPGHAPAETLDEVLARLESGGLFVFSLNDHALQDGSYEWQLSQYLDTGGATLLFKEHGPHLPALEMEASVYVLQKP